MDVILASTSSYRRALLDALGIPFRSIAPGVDEDAREFVQLAPGARAEALALAKARAVADRFPEATIIGCDQVAALGDEILHKPGSAEAAIAQLRALRGKTHLLHTALAVLQAGARRAHADVARMTMRALTEADICRYVALDEPVDCAGGYKFESHGASLFERVECADTTAITGMPMRALSRLLETLPHAILVGSSELNPG